MVAGFGYDNAYRLTGVQFPGYASQNASVQYDPAGRPTVVMDATGSTTVHYDPVLKRLTSVQTLLGGRTYTVSFGYAGDGQVLSMTTPAGTTNYGYDAAGRLVLMTAPAGDTTSWTYDGAGRVLTESTLTTAGRTITTAYGYGPSGQPRDPSTAPAYLRTIAQTVNGQTFKTYTLTHSYLGQTTAVSASGGTSGEVENAAFAYDARGRLTADSETVTVFGTPYGASGSYQWDLSSNLQGGTGGWTYNSNNQVTFAPPMGGLAGATGLGYDAAGNLTSANGMGLSWDAWGNLSSVTGAPGSPSFSYDAFGRRVSKTVGGVTTDYVYAGSMLVCELDANGNVLRSYNWGALGLVSEYTASGPSYYLFDDRGDTRAVLDANGTVIARGAYTAWGSPVPGLNPGVAMGWKGRYGVTTDAETGLVHMGARYYAPCIGSFLSRDPIGFEGGINLYAYCGGDPINWADPSGMDMWEFGQWCIGFAKGIGRSLCGFTDMASLALVPRLPLAAFQYCTGRPVAPLLPGSAIANRYLQLSNSAQKLGEENFVLCTMGLAMLPSVSPALVASKPMAAAEEVAAAGSVCPRIARAYSVAFEATIPRSARSGNRWVHNQWANESLLVDMAGHPGFASAMEDLIPGLHNAIISPSGASGYCPPGWTWHHSASPGVMQLVPYEQHTGTAFQSLLHPGRRGGYAVWGP